MSVKVQQYDPNWPLHFQKIKARLEACLEHVSYIAIEHVGSTSVPGLAAKPIIDTDIIVARENVQPAIDALVSHGFTYFGELGIIDRHAVRDPDQTPPRNTYICVDGAFQLHNHLGVRDTLRANPELREEYGRVKLELASRRINLVDYLEGKNAVVTKILAAAGLLSEQEALAVQNSNKKGERYGKIETERLELREFGIADVDSFFELESKEEVVRYQSFSPRTKEQANKEVVKIIQGSCAVPRKHIELLVEYEGQFVGRVGANISPSTSNPAQVGESTQEDLVHAELWFSFLPEFQRKGFASEAVTALIKLLKEKFQDEKLELEIECDPRNTGSWKLAEKLSFDKISERENVYESKGETVGSMVYRKLT